MFLLGVTLKYFEQQPSTFRAVAKIRLTKGQSTKIVTALAPVPFKHYLALNSQIHSPSLTEVKRLAIFAMVVWPFM